MPTSGNSSDATKKVSLKISIIKRCAKEIDMYKQELLGQTAHISKLEADHACPHNIKKQYEVLEETKLMLPDCEKRLENARNDLAKLLQFTDQTQLEPFLLEEANKLIQ